ncbi:hypothetical protein MTBBW1_610004 [Desulfamplus magnetovallimortis]|uniref:Uncharacterized protein n=1 Tax=Desulfamplus magnetovallimortis TaxID=1246637 RepID=A0A1W1HIP7_9BACT|nr:hypothetical protein [Desulfamplus magnetovallimortis]SLM32252.1 hypothetical protein MTBBW1_610004 [Desulfamplus magnetovallimortis]
MYENRREGVSREVSHTDSFSKQILSELEVHEQEKVKQTGLLKRFLSWISKGTQNASKSGMLCTS